MSSGGVLSIPRRSAVEEKHSSSSVKCSVRFTAPPLPGSVHVQDNRRRLQILSGTTGQSTSGNPYPFGVRTPVDFSSCFLPIFLQPAVDQRDGLIDRGQ